MPFADFRGRLLGRISALRISGTWLIAASLVVAVGLWVLGVIVLSDMRQSDYQQARRSAENIASTVETDIARNIELYDLSLQAVAENLRHPELDFVSAELRQLVLFDRAASAQYLGSIRVTDRTGLVTIDSRTTEMTGASLAERDYFKAHLDNPDVGLYVGHPFIGLRGHYNIGISRRMTRPDGSFAGIVAGALRLDYFRELFRKVRLGPNSFMAVLHADGTLLMRSPFLFESIGRSLGGTEVFKRAAQLGNGNFEMIGVLDGKRKLYTVRQVANLPLIVMIGTSTDEIYASWRREAWMIASAVVMLSLGILLLALFAAHELRQRAKAERQLAVLASTDGLTGLANRRAFDDLLDLKWMHAASRNDSIALLMIDVDYFKAYNDKNGHQAGDMALIAAARCIESVKRDGVDVVARYGGEEFAVLLPDTTLAEAFKIGERIRWQMQAFSANGADFPTVSIGIASHTPQHGHKASDLVTSADLALYAAKSGGRNRTEAAPVLSVSDAAQLAA
jgi:diguanylate cyclase (GGDEF)-like protein